MSKIFKPENLKFESDNSALEQFDLLTLSPRLSTIAKSKHFVFDVRKLEPGKYSFPYHFHRNAEELIFIISGSLTIRTPEGFEIAKKGDIIFFEMGESGAHQFFNHDNTVPCEYLDLRTTVGIDVSEYPDSDKIGIWPFGDILKKGSQIDYNEGEEDVQLIWEKLKRK